MMKNIFHAFFTVPLFVLVLVSCAPEEGAEDSMIDFSALTSRPLAELPDEKIASRVFIPMDTSRAEFLFDRVSDVKFRADRIYLLLWRRHHHCGHYLRTFSPRDAGGPEHGRDDDVL